MNEIRSWLDSHKIQPTDFRFKHSVTGAAAFEIKFNREEEACLFERAFTRPPSEPSGGSKGTMQQTSRLRCRLTIY